jgi:hypothetical protein
MLSSVLKHNNYYVCIHILLTNSMGQGSACKNNSYPFNHKILNILYGTYILLSYKI